jgi:hypothetical protein
MELEVIAVPYGCNACKDRAWVEFDGGIASCTVCNPQGVIDGRYRKDDEDEQSEAMIWT